MSFSRDSPDGSTPHYVQDNICIHGDDLVTLITNQRAQVYVCGDATNMAKGVRQAFIEILRKHKGWYHIHSAGFDCVEKLRQG